MPEKVFNDAFTSIIGEVIYKSEAAAAKMEINLTSQCKGFYFIKLTAKKGAVTKKVIKE